MKRISVLLSELAVLIFAFAQMASAALTTLFVATNATGDGSGSNWANAMGSIQDAISAIDTGNTTNTVWVSNGVYEVGGVTNWPAGTYLTNRVAITNAITVRSANNNPANTIIKGSGPNGDAAVRCVYMANNSSLIGFTLTNGATILSDISMGYQNRMGGGVMCKDYSINIKISNCVITGNSSTWQGGGVNNGAFYNCTIAGNTSLYGGGAKDCVLYNCTLANNSGSAGGGVRDSTLYNCTVASNTADSSGGGAYYCTMSNCIIIGNSAGSYGGGAGGSGGGAGAGGTLYNCLLIGNSAGSEGGAGARAAILYNCTIANNRAGGQGGGVRNSSMNNCIVYFNISTAEGSNNWCDSRGSTNSCTYPTNDLPGTENITNNPMFIDTNTANYRLSVNSPCVNTGTNQSWMTNFVDLDGRQRIRYGTVDIGAYEVIYGGTVTKVW